MGEGLTVSAKVLILVRLLLSEEEVCEGWVGEKVTAESLSLQQ